MFYSLGKTSEKPYWAEGVASILPTRFTPMVKPITRQRGFPSVIDHGSDRASTIRQLVKIQVFNQVFSVFAQNGSPTAK